MLPGIDPQSPRCQSDRNRTPHRSTNAPRRAAGVPSLSQEKVLISSRGSQSRRAHSGARSAQPLSEHRTHCTPMSRWSTLRLSCGSALPTAVAMRHSTRAHEGRLGCRQSSTAEVSLLRHRRTTFRLVSPSAAALNFLMIRHRDGAELAPRNGAHEHFEGAPRAGTGGGGALPADDTTTAYT